MSAADVQFFLSLRNQIKLYHWQTHSFARHKATDEVLDSLDKVIDEYVEVYAGKYGRPRIGTGAGTNTIKLANLSEKSAVAFVKSAIQHLQGPLVKRLKPSDTDLMNLRDELLGHLNQLLYLFSLH